MASTSCPYQTNRRYLHVASGLPLTLRYVGGLPNTSSVWLGVEWDNAGRGKHSGTYKGQEVFTTRVPGAGSFIKYSPETSSAAPLLEAGPSFVDVISERYAHADSQGFTGEIETVVLGSSNGNIIVEAPRLEKIRRKLTNLDNLKEAALEGLWISEAGQGDLQGGLRSLTRLNLSQNLLVDWEEVGRIYALTPALTALVLNQSRLKTLAHSVFMPTITQLHLGNTLTAWDELPWLSKSMPNLTTLHLNSCFNLGKLVPLRDSFSSLKTLNLESTVLGNWADFVSSLTSLQSLQNIDLSSVSFDSIPLPSDEQPCFSGLTQLTLLDTSVKRWTDIDALAAWTDSRLESLRISVKSPATGSDSMKGDLSDRPILIAKLRNLKSLNSTLVTDAERVDSERFYVTHVSRTAAEDPNIRRQDWGRYEELCGVHGDPAASQPILPKRNILASKLITIYVHTASGDYTSLHLLPSAPLRLVKRKIIKALSLPSPVPMTFTCWTVQNADDLKNGEDVNTGVEIDDDSKEIGWWLQDGDYIHVDL